MTSTTQPPNLALNSAYRWEELNSLAFHYHEFGVPRWNGMRFHKLADDLIVGSFDGHRVFEIRPDDSWAFVLEHKSLRQGLKSRWIQMLTFFDSLSSKVTSRANGTRTYTFSAVYRANPEAPYSERKYGHITGSLTEGKFTIVKEGDSYAFKQVEAKVNQIEKDKAKYRAFNGQLKALKAALTAQLKMDVYKKYEDSGRWDVIEEAFKLVHDQFRWDKESNWLPWDSYEKSLDRYVEDWIAKPNPSFLHPIVVLCCRLHSSDANDKKQKLLRKVTNGLRAAQVRYLRNHCITISESKNSLSLSNESATNQDSQLLPHDGFREVQVPCEAEVC